MPRKCASVGHLTLNTRIAMLRSFPAQRRCSAKVLFALAAMLLASTAHAAPTVAIITSNNTPVAGGAAFTYTVTVTNPDAVAANNVSVAIPLPAAVLLQSVALSGTGGGAFSCNQPPTAENGLVLCRAPTMLATTTATITLTATISPDTASGVRSTAARLSVAGTATTATVNSTIQINAPLSVTLSGPNTAAAGDRVSYLLTVNNGGNSTALNAVITGVLPVGFSHFSAQGTGGLANACDYTASTRTLSCSSIDLPSGVARLTWTAEIAPGTPPGVAQISFTLSSAGTGTIGVGSASVNTTVSN